MATRSRLVATCLLLASTPLIVACDVPAPPSWPLPDDAQSVKGPAEVLLATELAGLPANERITLSSEGPESDGRTLLLAFDGKRLVGEVKGGAEPTAVCPLVVYVSTDAGAHHHVFRVAGKDTAATQIFADGGKYGGSAPRTAFTEGGARFLLPILQGDAAIAVESCATSPATLPPLVIHMKPGGGLQWHSTLEPTVAGVRGENVNGVPGSIQGRYQPGETVALIGSGLERLEYLMVGDDKVMPITQSAREAVFAMPAEGGDTDTVVPYTAGTAMHGILLPVEGTVHQIGDAMGALSSAVWGEWLVFLLVGVGLICTILNGFPQFRGFGHAIAVIRGRYDNPKEKGEISHFQALTAALSATVGLGNIAGVAVAVTSGGPGAIFWMWVCGFLGMATKYSECTLATHYREVHEDGTVSGGPMYYIAKGLPRYLKPMAFIFAGLIIFASFGGGNMFQSNQAAALWSAKFGVPTWVTGILLVGLVGLVIVGGIKRIGRVTDKLVPTMCGIYFIGALVVIFSNIDRVGDVFSLIFTEAFSVSAAVGGVLGIVMKDVVVQGFRRAAFSNEAGFGSAAIAHAAVKTDEPVREGVVALLEPFIDTIVICTMTGLVVVLSGLWTQQGLEGATLTAASFNTAFDGFGSYLIPIAVFLFAISTMIAWSYYGEKGVRFLFGQRAVMPYRMVFVGLVFVGAVWKLGPVLDFSDAMLGLLAVPNLIAVLLLSPKLRGLTKDYFGRLKDGTMKRYK